MECCVLCLEINKNISDCIKTNSVQWTELNVEKIVEKHLWTMNNIHLCSWICFSCWKELEGFHRFYLRIEEAHLNFGKIKVERLAETLELQEELIINKETNDFLESIRDELEFGPSEPESRLDQTQQECSSEPIEFSDNSKVPDIDFERESISIETLNGLDDIPLNQVSKLLKSQRIYLSKDKEKSLMKEKRKSIDSFRAEEISIENFCTGEFIVKEEPSDSNCTNDVENDNDKAFEVENFCSESLEIKGRKSRGKNRSNREDNDKFIAEHFKQMFCTLCKVPFEDFSAMKKHFAENHKQRGYVVCCKRKYFDRARLADHLHCHINPDHFKCKECGKVATDRTKYENHMLEKHKLYCCFECGKNYVNPNLFYHHKREVHLYPLVGISHIRCNDTNSNENNQIEMDQCHLPVVNCDVCGLVLISERDLKMHKKSQHPAGGKHHCPICPKQSPTLNALKMHIKFMHERGYDYKCSICEKAFKRPGALKDHMSIHTGTKLYNCPWCPKTFNSNGNMHTHRRKRHPKEWSDFQLKKLSGNIKTEI